jgi:LAO/AO transport system kinase
MSLLDKFKSGDLIALSKIISRVENRRNGYQDVLAELYSRSGHAVRIGITGPPGAGKSSLVFRLAQLLSGQGKRVGVIAVDPTSPFTGGALLGDRIRMQDLSGDPNIYIRSMATRGSTGGLAVATRDTAMLLDAFGKEIILIETVGVGQVELDIARACDTVVVVFVPESGDAVQAMKAGLMEIADVYCLNKSDREGADRLVLELQSVLGLRNNKTEWDFPIVQTQAINNKGIGDLWTAVQRHTAYRRDAAPRDRRREMRVTDDLLTVLHSKIDRRLERALENSDLLRRAVRDILDERTNPYAAADTILEQISDRLSE